MGICIEYSAFFPPLSSNGIASSPGLPLENTGRSLDEASNSISTFNTFF